MLRIVVISCGCVFLSLGIVGIFLPILPTTPFLLLASACFLRSSNKLYRWLTNHRLFGNYLIAYHLFKAVTVRAKVVSIVLLWSSIIFSVFVIVSEYWQKALLFLIATGVSVHLIRLKTLIREMQEILAQECASAHPPLQNVEKRGDKGQTVEDND